MEHSRRLVSALVLLPPLVAFLIFASHGLFLLLICVVIGLSFFEYFRLLPLPYSPLCVGLSYAFAIALACTAHWQGKQGLSLTLSLGMVLLSGCVLWRAGSTSAPLPALVQSLFGILLIGWGLSHLILLRRLPWGTEAILLLCGVLWIGDAAAMYVGKGLGRHPMALSISPGKTWEGALGGMASCLVVTAVGSYFLLRQLSLPQSLIVGFLLSCAAQVSDLTESLLKRHSGVKDSGGLIPGHGGLLDRIDSLFFAAPVAFYLLDFMIGESSV
jgi:phosphatidate cytidylyltransferase